jgi:Nitrile hydratase, alpha chain.
MDANQIRVQYGKIVVRCWEDADFKSRFIAHPADVLKEYGLPTQEGVEYKVIEAPKMTQYIVIPAPGANTEEGIKFLCKLLLNHVENNAELILPPGVELRLLQNSDTVQYLIVPFFPELLTADEKATLHIDPSRSFVEGAAEMVSDVVSTVTAVDITTATTEATVTAFVVACGVAVVI